MYNNSKQIAKLNKCNSKYYITSGIFNCIIASERCYQLSKSLQTQNKSTGISGRQPHHAKKLMIIVKTRPNLIPSKTVPIE